jgi:3-hydroxybutyryl-CoA dehydrogenase
MSEIKTIGVAGCGTMGAGIAIVAARAGFRTKVFDLREDALVRARQQTEGFLRKSVERGKLPADALPTIMAQWSSTTQLADLADCDLVKQREFRRIWPFFRDRRIDAYGDLTRRLRD